MLLPRSRCGPRASPRTQVRPGGGGCLLALDREPVRAARGAGRPAPPDQGLRLAKRMAAGASDAGLALSPAQAVGAALGADDRPTSGLDEDIPAGRDEP